MAKFIAVLSGKGGVGKTTTSINLALAMSKKGGDIVLLDGNLSSPNLSVHLGDIYHPVTIHDVLQNFHDVVKAIHHHEVGIKIIPADLSISAMKTVDFEKLYKVLQDLHLHTDYVLIDGSPGLGRETEGLINLSDEIIIVTNPDLPSVLSAKRVKNFAAKKKKTVIGVLLTKHKSKFYNMSKEEVEKLIGLPVIGVIPEDKRFMHSVHHKKPYIHLYPKRKASKEYEKLASILTGRVL